MFTVIIVVCSLKSMCVPSFIVIGYCVSELHGRYCNILPEAVYCCYTRTTLFTKKFTCLYESGCYHITKVCYSTSVKIIKNEVGCRDDTVPKTVETRRHCEED